MEEFFIEGIRTVSRSLPLQASRTPRFGATLLRLASIEFRFRILLWKWTVSLVALCLVGEKFMYFLEVFESHV